MKVNVDRVVVEQVTIQFMHIIRTHLRKGEPDRRKVFELLNALAITVAAVINDNDGAQEWFNGALEEQIDEFLKTQKAKQ